MRQVLPVLWLVLCCAAVPARAQGDLQKLQQQLAERDALIQDLVRRVEALEQRLHGAAPAPAPSAPAANAAAASRTAASAPADATPEEDTARALERALVREGGLVLPPRAFEIETAYQYTYDGRRGLAVVQTAAGPQLAEGATARQRHEASLGLRVGLPGASQLALRVPYAQARNRSAAAAVAFDQSERASGIGDVEVQFTKQVMDERPGRPALLASLTWKAATGEFRAGQPSPGSGFDGLQAALTAVKRQDPLVFFGGLSYTAYRERVHGGVAMQPGPAVGARLGTLLAASPQSSLRLGLDLSRATRTRVNGAAAPGTETVSGLIELGLVSMLTRSTSLDLSVGFGVTADAPRLRLGVALPVRFN